MNRFRFYVPGDDGRPLTVPPPGPFWVTGYSDTHTVVVAFAPSLQDLTAPGAWPDAEEIEDMGEMPITFSGRFPKPEWYTEPAAKDATP